MTEIFNFSTSRLNPHFCIGKNKSIGLQSKYTGAMGKLARHLHLNIRGTITVVLNQALLRPGDTLSGTVRLTVTKPIENAVLKARAEGTQHLVWLTSSGQGVISHAKAFDHFIDEIELTDAMTVYEVGDHDVPFSFKLPDDMQWNVSYACKWVEEMQAVRVAVEHSVTVRLEVKGFTKADLSSKVLFVVEPLPAPRPVGVPIAVSHSAPIKFLGLFKSGVCSTNMDIDTNVFDSSSTIEARVSVQLETKRRLEFIMVELFEQVLVNRYDPLFKKIKRGRRVVCCRRFDQSAIDHLRSSDASRSSCDGASALTLRLPITPNDISEFDPLTPTMTTHFIDLSYGVRIVLKLSMAPSVKIEAPVIIVATTRTQLHSIAA